MESDQSQLWAGSYKIPWDDPDFSRRMLSEHLSQEHDLASRRTEWIEQQVQWIHAELLNSKPSRILDLGCGPGLYCHRLVRLGHQCAGIDFGPASIAYARQHNPEPSRCRFVLGDLRRAEFGGPYDLAMFLYGELNVFPSADAFAILAKTRDCLEPGGRLIAEVQTAESVERMGHEESVEKEYESGLFSERPHCCRTESCWLPEQKVALQTFTVTERETGSTRVYRSTTQAWPKDEVAGLLRRAGYVELQPLGSWPSDSEGLTLWTGLRS